MVRDSGIETRIKGELNEAALLNTVLRRTVVCVSVGHLGKQRQENKLEKEKPEKYNGLQHVCFSIERSACGSSIKGQIMRTLDGQ